MQSEQELKLAHTAGPVAMSTLSPIANNTDHYNIMWPTLAKLLQSRFKEQETITGENIT